MLSRLVRILASTAVAGAALATPAAAADPIMRLADVRPGMQCTGYSVVRGIEPASFSVEIFDVIAGDAASAAPRLLIGVSGPAVDVTGVGPGFSGSPVYCPDAQGTPRIAGAISESVGEYAGKVALATPIESVLGVPVEAPAGARPRELATRPLATPLTVSGLSPSLARAVQRASGRAGRPILAAPAVPAGDIPVHPLRPGSSMAAGLAEGDLNLAAIGAVTYVDGDRVWGFGHPLDGVGARSLFLQNAYVYRVINNPVGLVVGTYKLAAPGRTVGALTYDGLSAVAGRTGTTPGSIPVAIRVRDRATGKVRRVDLRAADETDLGDPVGISPVGLMAPLAVAEGVTTTIGASPPRLTGTQCVRIALRERRRPVGFCNRYVTETPTEDFLGLANGVAIGAAQELDEALRLIEDFEGAPVHAQRVSSRIAVREGAFAARLRGATLPRRVRAGQRVRVTLRLEMIDGRAERRSFRLRVPSQLRPGSRRLIFEGTEPDRFGDSEDLFLELSSDARRSSSASISARKAPSVRTRAIEKLAAEIASIHRYDGVYLRTGPDEEGTPVFRDRVLRIAGRASARVQVRKAPRSRRR